MTWDRDHVYIKGQAVRHTTAARDWACGLCGSKLITVWCEDAPHWRTRCWDSWDHHADEFVHKSTWAYMEHDRLTGAAQAQDVFDHLPAETQAAIAERS